MCAKVKLGTFTTSIQGSIGGNVFLKGKGGNIIRTNNGQTKKYSLQRSYTTTALTLAAKTWRTLTQAQRDGWNYLAQNYPLSDAFGNMHIVSGYNFYIKTSYYYWWANGTVLSTAPAPTLITQPQAGTAVYNGSSGLLVVPFPSGSGANNRYYLSCTRPMSKGVNAFNQKYCIIRQGSTNGGIPECSAIYNARFGAPPIGLVIFMRVINASNTTGLFSAPWLIKVVVGA